MLHVNKWASVFIMIVTINCSALGADAEKTNPDSQPQTEPATVAVTVPKDLHYDKPDDMPFLTINTDAALDLNWSAALEFTDPTLRPTPVILPFLTDYPIDNLEIKLRVLNLKF